MQIVKRGKIENLARCEHFGTELKYDKYDLWWSHTEECYYLVCPVCKEIIWLNGTPELDKMYHEAWIEKHPEDK